MLPWDFPVGAAVRTRSKVGSTMYAANSGATRVCGDEAPPKPTAVVRPHRVPLISTSCVGCCTSVPGCCLRWATGRWRTFSVRIPLSAPVRWEQCSTYLALSRFFGTAPFCRRRVRDKNKKSAVHFLPLARSRKLSSFSPRATKKKKLVRFAAGGFVSCGIIYACILRFYHVDSFVFVSSHLVRA